MNRFYTPQQVAAIVVYNLLAALNTVALHNTKADHQAIRDQLRKSALAEDPLLPAIESLLGLES